MAFHRCAICLRSRETSMGEHAGALGVRCGGLCIRAGDVADKSLQKSSDSWQVQYKKWWRQRAIIWPMLRVLRLRFRLWWWLSQGTRALLSTNGATSKEDGIREVPISTRLGRGEPEEGPNTHFHLGQCPGRVSNNFLTVGKAPPPPTFTSLGSVRPCLEHFF